MNAERPEWVINLVRLRRLRGLTAAAVAEAVGSGITREVLAKIESGRRQSLRVDELLALSAALNVDVWDIDPRLLPNVQPMARTLVERALAAAADEIRGRLQ